MRYSLAHWFAYIILLAAVCMSVACSNASDSEKINPPVLNNANEVRLQQIRSLTEALEKNPNSHDILYKRAKIYLEQNETRLALYDIQKAIEIDSSHSNYYLTLARIYRKTAKIEPALKAAHKAEMLSLPEPDVFNTLGELYLIIRKYKEAISYFNKALNASPIQPDAHFYKSICFAEMGDTTEAIHSLLNTIEQKPEYADAYNNLARIYIAQKKYELTKQYLQTGLRFAPNDAYIYYNCGVLYEQLGQIDTAITLFKKAIQLENTMYAAYYNIGILEMNRRNYPQARDWFEQTVRYEPKLSEAYYRMGICAEYMNDLENAKIYYDRVIELKGNLTAEAEKQLARLYQAARNKNSKSKIDSSSVNEPVNLTYADSLELGLK